MNRRIAALYDIHGNLPALEAVLAEVRVAQADTIVVGGDVTPGPMCAEVLATLESLDAPVHYLYGNCEVAVLAEMDGRNSGVPEPHRAPLQWVAEQLRDSHRAEFTSWPLTVRLTHATLGDTLFCHATPRNENEIFSRLTSDETLRPVFATVDASVVVCGHTHMQFDRRVGDVRVVNAGSVGMPFGSTGAYWLLLGDEIEFRCTAYDLDAAAERIRRSSYPWAEQFAAQNVLTVPNEETILAAFAKAELRP